TRYRSPWSHLGPGRSPGGRSLLPSSEEAGQARLQQQEAHQEVHEVLPQPARRPRHVDLVVAVLLLAAELDLEVREALLDLLFRDALEVALGRLDLLGAGLAGTHVDREVGDELLLLLRRVPLQTVLAGVAHALVLEGLGVVR